MILILGGAYQGKLGYAKEKYGLGEEEICICEGEMPDFSARCLDRVERCALACVRRSLDPTEEFRKHREQWKDSILIAEDIFCGVVPMDPALRLWRQETGRLCQYLASEAESVVRIFCGLEQRLK